VDEKKEVRNRQSKPRPYFMLKKVGGEQHVQVETDKFSPSHSLFALWGRGNAVAFEDVPHRLVTDCIAQMVQCALDAGIAP
jgi:hypothetical protein